MFFPGPVCRPSGILPLTHFPPPFSIFFRAPFAVPSSLSPFVASSPSRHSTFYPRLPLRIRLTLLGSALIPFVYSMPPPSLLPPPSPSSLDTQHIPTSHSLHRWSFFVPAPPAQISPRSSVRADFLVLVDTLHSPFTTYFSWTHGPAPLTLSLTFRC